MRISRQDLLTELESIQPGLSSRDIIEQSSCVVWKNGHVYTFNDEIFCRFPSCLDIEGAVNADPLLKLLRKMTEEQIDVELNEGKFIVKGKRSKTRLNMEAEIFLPIDEVNIPEKFRKLDAEFGMAVDIVGSCASKDQTTFVLTCVHITPTHVEACDNYQLARYPLGMKLKRDICVRFSSLKAIVQLGMSQFAEDSNWCHFRNEAGLICSVRRYVEDYPELDRLFEFDGAAASFPKGLVDAADRAEIFSNDNADDNQVLVEIQEGRLRITGEGAAGKHQEVKDLEYNGPALRFLVSPVLLRQLTERHSECVITTDRLRVDGGGKFTYVTCLGAAE
jgi:DNA polymerase III sliding clamp (beta) subunit (PCNA family)